jgi:hypothetical protein
MDMRRIVLMALVIAALALATTPATARSAPHAGPPSDVEWPVFFITPDEDHGLVTFVNITRAAFCAWVDAGFAGPPPVNELLTLATKETGQGALVVRARAVVDFEVWEISGPPGPATYCADGPDEPWGTATSQLVLTDNDEEISGTRTNSFGWNYQLAVTDRDGVVWRYSFHARFAFDRDGEFHIRARGFTLARTGRPA